MVFFEKLRKIPFLRILIPIIIGILLNSHTNYPPPDLYVFLISLLIFISGVINQKLKLQIKNYSIFFGLTSFVFFVVIGASLIINQTNTKFHFPNSPTQQFYIGYFCDYPVIKQNSIQAVIKIEKKQKDKHLSNINIKILAFFFRTKEFLTIEPGTRILLKANILRIENNGNPEEFNVKRYFQTKNIHYKAFLKRTDWRIAELKPKRNIKIITKKIRNNILDIYTNYGFSGPGFSVLSALSLGEKKDIDPDIRQNFSSSGAMHILAVSGLHVGIIYLLLSFILKFLKKIPGGLIIRALLLIIILWLYAFITGLSPSVCRATVMLTFYIIGNLAKRKGSIYNIISLTAFLLLIINPSLIFSPGFQLSFIAVIGILFFYPIIYKLIKIKNSFLDKIWKISSVSIAAQLATFPISIFYFNIFPNYFLFTNLLAIPLATVILYISILLIILSSISFIGAAISFILKFLVSALILFTEFITDLPFSTNRNIYFSQEKVFLLYIIIILFVIFFYSKNGKTLVIILSIIICFQIRESIILYNNSISKRIILWNSNNENFHVISGRKNILFIKNKKAKTNENLNLLVKNYNRKFSRYDPEIKKIEIITDTLMQNNTMGLFLNNGFGYFSNKRILIINKKSSFVHNNNKDFQIDYIFLLNDCKLDPNMVLMKLMPEKIIIGSVVTANARKKWRKAADKLDISSFSVKDDGAFILNIH